MNSVASQIPGAHRISIATTYGAPVDAEQVPAAEFSAALHRIYRRAIAHANAVVVLDGVMHTRNSFLEFVRAFDECAARADRRAGMAHA
jgi:hypothetical protein